METKHLTGAIDVKSVQDSGEFEAILSMPTVDRDGEIIAARAFEPLPARIPIDIDHGLTASKTVGSGTPYYDGDVLMVRGTFASTALGQEIRTLVKEGHVGHMSVAFRGAQYAEKSAVPTITKAELLNAAIVAIPSNREASILVSKSFGEDLAVMIKTAVREVLSEQKTTALLHSATITNIDAKTAVAEFNAIGDAAKSPNTEPPADTAAPVAAVNAGAEVDVARALADAELALAEAALAL